MVVSDEAAPAGVIVARHRGAGRVASARGRGGAWPRRPGDAALPHSTEGAGTAATIGATIGAEKFEEGETFGTSGPWPTYATTGHEQQEGAHGPSHPASCNASANGEGPYHGWILENSPAPAHT